MKTHLAIALMNLASSYAYAMTGAPPLPKFHEVVSEKIFRGAVPSSKGIDELAKMKVRTVLDIRDENPVSTQYEREQVIGHGMTFVTIPISSLFSPSDKDMNAILETITNPGFQPIFFHCTHGEDRTGLVVGLFRVTYQQVSPKDAYQEMLEFGFHPALIGLRHYFEKRVGYDTGVWGEGTIFLEM